MKSHLWKLFGESNIMSRNLLQMTKKIFDELKTGVQEEHKEYIIDVERHININESYRDKCCDFLKKATIIGLDKESLFTIVFIRYERQEYIGIDSRYAEEFEKDGYVVEEAEDIMVGRRILCLSEQFYQLKADSMKLINCCLGLEPEEGKDSVVFSPEEILDLVYDISIFNLTYNELNLSMESQDDLKRLFLLLMVNKNENLLTEFKNTLSELATMTAIRKISNNLLDFVAFNDNRIKFLTLYQCIEFLFIPSRASEFKKKYHMNIEDALNLHINEAMRRDERANVMAVLREYAGKTIIHKFHEELFGEKDDDNKLERLNNWIYDLRCTIAHFRYGQIKEDNEYDWDKIFSLMLDLLVAIYRNIDQDVQDICNGIIVV